jgi:hypothetical protein
MADSEVEYRVEDAPCGVGAVGSGVVAKATPDETRP